MEVAWEGQYYNYAKEIHYSPTQIGGTDKAGAITLKVLQSTINQGFYLRHTPALWSLFQIWPATLRLKFVDDFLHCFVIEFWTTQLIVYDFLQFLGVERDDVLLEMIYVHVCRIRCVGHRWIGFCDHFCPITDMAFIDLFNSVVEFELRSNREQNGTE